MEEGLNWKKRRRNDKQREKKGIGEKSDQRSKYQIMRRRGGIQEKGEK